MNETSLSSSHQRERERLGVCENKNIKMTEKEKVRTFAGEVKENGLEGVDHEERSYFLGLDLI